MNELNQIIEAVKENDAEHESSWKDWEVSQIVQAYADRELSGAEINALEILIDTDGDFQALADAMCDGEYLKNSDITKEEADEIYYLASRQA